MRTGRRATLGTAVVVLAACSSTMRVHLDEFQSEIFRSREPTYSGPFLRSELRKWHMTTSDIDCFVDEAMKEPYVPPTPPLRSSVWTPEQLNGYAATCEIDLSELWFEMDRPEFMDD